MRSMLYNISDQSLTYGIKLRKFKQKKFFVCFAEMIFAFIYLSCDRPLQLPFCFMKLA